MLATAVDCDTNIPSLIAATPKCRKGVIPFCGLLHFTLNTYLTKLNVKQGGINYHFLVFGITQSGIEPFSPEPLANTQPSWSIGWYKSIIQSRPDEQT